MESVRITQKASPNWSTVPWYCRRCDRLCRFMVFRATILYWIHFADQRVWMGYIAYKKMQYYLRDGLMSKQY